jgi:hypothetical protein
MNTKRILVMFSILTSMLFSAHSTFTYHGHGGSTAAWAVPTAVFGAAAITSAASGAARDRDYARYRAEEARRRERDAERRHEEKMAAIQGSQYPVSNRYPVGEDYGYEE